MTERFTTPPGATPLDGDAAEQLIPALTTQGELNAFEASNIDSAMRWVPASRLLRSGFPSPRRSLLGLLAVVVMTGCGAASSGSIATSSPQVSQSSRPTEAAVPPNPNFDEAVKAWRKSAKADIAGRPIFWTRAWTFVAEGLDEDSRAGTATSADYVAAMDHLMSLRNLPSHELTPAQSREFEADIAGLNSFFGTGGLYGLSPPSATTEGFRATLEQEIRSGDLGVIGASFETADFVLPPVDGASVVCPVLPKLAAGVAFACVVTTSHPINCASPAAPPKGLPECISGDGGGARTIVIVGQLGSADAASFDVAFGFEGDPFECEAHLLTPEEVSALKAVGGRCRNE